VAEEKCKSPMIRNKTDILAKANANIKTYDDLVA
jgi:hypothetical protein